MDKFQLFVLSITFALLPLYPAMAQTQTKDATLSGNTITSSYTSYSVDFGSAFSSIARLCFDFTFSGDLFDPNENIEYSYLPMPTNTWGGFVGTGLTAPMSTLTSCTVASYDINEALDGSFSGSIWMKNGTVYLQSMKVSLENAVVATTTTIQTTTTISSTTTTLATALSQCTLNSPIPSSGCSCEYRNYYSGYCCGFGGGYYSASSCVANCPQGAIPSSGCYCSRGTASGPLIEYSGYCCWGSYSPTACATTIEPCTDSDGGMNFNTKGTGSGNYKGATTREYRTYEDYCATSTQLNEAFCDSDGYLSAFGQQCSGGCQNGACVSATTTTTPSSSGTCANGPIPGNGACVCNGVSYNTGYCCNNVYSSSTPCSTNAPQCSEGAVPSSGCLCGGYAYKSGYCCRTNLQSGLVWAGNTPCTQTCTSIGGVCCYGAVSDCVGTWSNQWAVDCQGYACCIGTCKTATTTTMPPAGATTTLPPSSGGGGAGSGTPTITSPTTPPSICGNGRCESGEYPGNCFSDCGQYCPQIINPSCIAGGYIINGGTDSSGCPRPNTCCGDNVCNGPEDSNKCPQDCGIERPLCGDGHCDIGEDRLNCANDCRGECPVSINCPDGSQNSCAKRDSGCFCEPCPIQQEVLPPGCTQTANKFTGSVNIICSGGTVCPPLPRVDFMESECIKNGGKFMLKKDSAGCEYPDCLFVEVSASPFQGYSKCHTQDDLEAIKIKCADLNLPVQIDVKGECKVVTCGRPSEQICERQTESERRVIENKCREQGLRLVKNFDESGCTILECRETFECQKELPEQAYQKCQSAGGEMVIKKDENGCVRFADCLQPGDDRDARVDPIERVPEAPELLEIAFKLEELRIKLDRLATQADQVAAYYQSVNSPDAERWKRVADMFESAVSEIDNIKNDLRNKLDIVTVDDLLEVRRSVRYISDVLLKDITYVMLSTSDDIAKINEKKDCDRDESCFNRAFRRCQPTIFLPEGTQGPKVELTGLENNACVLNASMQTESGLVDMACKIPNYAKGIRNPETDIFPYCEGSMLEALKQQSISDKVD